jgi:type II secretory pathway pseudopilin PulG
MNPLRNQKGYLLLEILLSLTLLSLVLTVFFGYFVQSRNHVIQNDSIGTASQLSQEILVKVRESDFHTNLTLDNWKTLYGTDFTGVINLNNQNFYPEVTIESAETVIKQENLSVPSHFLDKLELITVVIKGDRKGQRVKMYETYGYKVREPHE